MEINNGGCGDLYVVAAGPRARTIMVGTTFFSVTIVVDWGRPVTTRDHRYHYDRQPLR
ncbi:hypothetical protein BH23CHL4_BH23CHL4_13820 [soil metagenome]